MRMLVSIGAFVLFTFCCSAAEPPADATAHIDLVYPNYRNLIFPDGGPIEVRAAVEKREGERKRRKCELRVVVKQGAVEKDVSTTLQDGVASISIPQTALAPGQVGIAARITEKKSGATVLEQTWNARRLSPLEVSRLSVYIDRNHNTVVEGKPFFPLGWYTSPREELLIEMEGSPFNCLLPYGTNHVSKNNMTAFLDKVQAKGMKLVYCMNDAYPAAKYFDGKDWEGIKGNEAISSAVVEAYKRHPAVLAWYLNDELPKTMVPELEDYYRRVAEADPNHPCFIVLCEPKEFSAFPTTTDIMGIDPYPIPRQPVTQVSANADRAQEAMRGLKPVWYVPQAFAWYQYDKQKTDRGRVPSEEDLKTGRPPTFEEERCMTYLGLVHGAKGLIYYCYYDFRVLPKHEEMWTWMKQIGNEVMSLSPVLLAPDSAESVQVSVDDQRQDVAKPIIHTMLKRLDGKLYLFAVNRDRESHRVTFTLPKHTPKQVSVLFENRTFKTHHRKLADDFGPLAVHVYEMEKRK